jgi:gluconolactonase
LIDELVRPTAADRDGGLRQPAGRVPESACKRRGIATKGGLAIDSFLEGPCLGPDGMLYVVDIPFGRIFAVDPSRQWHLVTAYDGSPHGMKVGLDGLRIVADYRRGLLSVDSMNGAIKTTLGSVNSEGFKGLNDLQLLLDGSILFTD